MRRAMSPKVPERALHALPAAALALVLSWAAWERFRLPMTPSADPDLWVYLAPGLSALTGHGFTHVYGQCFLYPGFLYALLRIGGDFRWITVVQSSLGLGTGVLFYACWRCLRPFLVSSPLPTAAYRLLGAALVGIYLLSTASISFERALRPEAIFPFFVSLHLYCNLRFIRFRFHDPQSRRAVTNGSLAVFFSVMAFLLKPSFTGSLILGNLPVVVSLFLPGPSALKKIALVGLPAVAVGALLLGPEWKLRQSDELGSLFVARSLFSIHADFIDDQMARDLAAGEQGRYPRAFLVEAHAALTQSLRESRTGVGKYWPTLGFNPDYLVYGDTEHRPFAEWVDDHLPDNNARAAFYRYHYRRAVNQQPAKMAAKALRQLGAFYRFGDCPAYLADDRLDLADSYQLAATVLETQPATLYHFSYDALTHDVALLRNIRDEIGPFRLTQRASRWLAKWYFTLLLGAFALAAGTRWLPAVRREYGATLTVLCLLYAYNFGTVFSLAITHSLDVGRYSRYQLVYTLLPEGVSIWLLAQVAFTVVADRTRSLRRRVYDRWASRPLLTPRHEGAHSRAPVVSAWLRWYVFGWSAENGSSLSNSLTQCVRCRPWVTLLGVTGLVLCLSGLATSVSSWRQAHKRGHHYKISKVLASPVLFGAGLATFHVGLLLGSQSGKPGAYGARTRNLRRDRAAL